MTLLSPNKLKMIYYYSACEKPTPTVTNLTNRGNKNTPIRDREQKKSHQSWPLMCHIFSHNLATAQKAKTGVSFKRRFLKDLHCQYRICCCKGKYVRSTYIVREPLMYNMIIFKMCCYSSLSELKATRGMKCA